MTSDLEKYYSLARPGTLACVQRTDDVYGDQYIFTSVLDATAGRISTLYGTFWAVNGERIDKRWNGNDNRLVLPTVARIEAEEAHLTSLYQFGTDRKFELAAARAVLERRATKMPNIPPPPIPTLEEAEVELRDATAYWMSIDQFLGSPNNSTRARKAASDRLSAAKTSLQLATKLNLSMAKKSNKAEANLKSGFSSVAGGKYGLTYNNLDAASYTLDISTAYYTKRGCT